MRRSLAVIDISDPYMKQLLSPLEDELEIPIEEPWDWEEDVRRELSPRTYEEIGIAVDAVKRKGALGRRRPPQTYHLNRASKSWPGSIGEWVGGTQLVWIIYNPYQNYLRR